ncbi:hypothetical protein M0802_009001 [Mischocyttarus mexicanus]|nr:hypothetical protein M0802_009001 [Mischocyttarus mexicanus]
MDTSGVTTRKRARTRNLRNKNSNSPKDFEKDIKNKKRSKINRSFKEDKQPSTRDSLNDQFSQENTSSEKSQKNYTSNRFKMIKNVGPKANKSFIRISSINDIENITCELINDSSSTLDMNNEQISVDDLSQKKIVTPISSPISISLTPRRTTKTPKKSPLHLNSPKTHSRVSLTTPKTPRKLMLSVNSPTIFNTSEISPQATNKHALSPKIIHSASKKISRLSKCPNIVLRSPKKSKRRSPKRGLSNKKNTSFTVLKMEKSPIRGILRKISNHSKENYAVNKSLSMEGDDLDETLTNSNNLSALYKEIISKQPMIILERIPLLENYIQSSNQHPLNSTFDILHFHWAQKKNKGLNNTNVLNLTSTPEIKRKLRLRISDNILFQLSPKASSSPTINLANKTNQLYNRSQNNSINVTEDEADIADETYELLEPKTSRLQDQCKKRKAGERNFDNKRETKKICKVHFAASETFINKSQTTVLNNKNAEHDSPISSFKPDYVNNIKMRKIPIINRMSSSMSNSLTNKSTSNSSIRRSLFNSNRKMDKASTSTLNKTKHIESKEEKDVKVHSAKKIPNFHVIHKKLFSRMESLVDNKIRLAKQHESLKSFSASKLNTRKSVKSLPAETKRDSYNRFGFKIRKPEATEIILKKQPPNRQQERREENRMLLTGVRTNRRFELQMKMRNLAKTK